MYGGRVILDYKDSNHRYTVTVDGIELKPSGATTIMDGTLEKKGLMTWPMGLALRYLTGFYDFENDQGNRMTGFTKDVGVIWNGDQVMWDGSTSVEKMLADCLAASKQWTIHQKAGGDIGTLVHDAVEQYITGTPFDITVDIYRDKVIEKEGAESIIPEWELKAPGEVLLANRAFDAFKSWWGSLGATVVLAEEILYSIKGNIAGTMDYLLEIPGKGLILADLKTSKASTSAGAPQGVYYQNFVQLGIYATMLKEMGERVPDDLMIISARKDGGFNTVYASEVGLTVDDCISWADFVIQCYYAMKRTKEGLRELYKRTKEDV